MKNNQKVAITKDGPYLVSGNIPLAKEISIVGKSGEPEEWKKGNEYQKQESYALCRCGMSKNKPFCDGSHIDAGFNDSDESLK